MSLGDTLYSVCVWWWGGGGGGWHFILEYNVLGGTFDPRVKGPGEL